MSTASDTEPFVSSEFLRDNLFLRIEDQDFLGNGAAKLDAVTEELVNYFSDSENPKPATVVIDMLTVEQVDTDVMISLVGRMLRFAEEKGVPIKWQLKKHSAAWSIFQKLLENMSLETYT